MLLFCIIIDILAVNTDSYFIVCQQLDTLCFSRHYHAYEVSYPEIPLYIIKELPFENSNTDVLGIIRLDTKLFITMKTIIHI